MKSKLKHRSHVFVLRGLLRYTPTQGLVKARNQQELALWGTHDGAGKHLLFSHMLTIFYRAENSQFLIRSGSIFQRGTAKV